MNMSSARVLTFPEFQQFLSEALEIRASALTREASFLRDLEVESLKLVEMILRMESDLGASVPVESAWRIETIGDVYQYYLDQAGAQEPAANASAQ
jgi:acyl carrier protein